jgi:proteic killer suppression protein
MIKTIKCKQTEKIFNMEVSTVLPGEIHQRAYNKLRMLHNSATLNDLKAPPANRLEKLKDNRAGQYSIRINNQWRICFKWHDGDAYDVEIVDYH